MTMTRAAHRYRATVAYAGTWFKGFQFQENAERTVQAVLETAIAAFAGEGPVRVHAAGRTDAGVHADGQVIHFDLWTPREPVRIREGVNALLPWDVRLLDAALAPEGFLSRRDAAWKEYLYRWSRAAVIPPKDSLFIAPIAKTADAAPMRAAAGALTGRKDFSIFGVRAAGVGVGVGAEGGFRRIYAAEVNEVGEEIRFLIRGDAFLRGMVRSICGVLAHVGREKAPTDRIAELLRTADRTLLAPKAAARGLTLARVHYEEAHHET